MIHTIKSYAMLTVASFCLATTSCKKDEPAKNLDKPVIPVTPSEKVLKGEVKLKQPTLILSLGESRFISRLLEATDVEMSKIVFEMSGDAKSVKIENSKLKAIEAGEVVLTLSYGEQRQDLSVLVVEGKKPIDMDADMFKKYVWDFEKSPKEIVNKTGRPVVVDFWAPWCTPCISMIPKMANIANKYDGKVLILKVNADPEKKTRIASIVYDAFYYFSDRLMKEMTQARDDGERDTLLPTVILMSKGKQEVKGLIKSEVFVPIEKYLDTEFSD